MNTPVPKLRLLNPHKVALTGTWEPAQVTWNLKHPASVWVQSWVWQTLSSPLGLPHGPGPHCSCPGLSAVSQQSWSPAPHSPSQLEVSVRQQYQQRSFSISKAESTFIFLVLQQPFSCTNAVEQTLLAEHTPLLCQISTGRTRLSAGCCVFPGKTPKYCIILHLPRPCSRGTACLGGQIS